MKTRLTHIFILMLSLVTTSCYKEEVVGHSENTNRTILFYMAADNDLADEVQEKIQAITAAYAPGPGENHLLIYLDAGTNGTPRLMEVKQGVNGSGNTLEVVEEYPDENSASERVFRRVLSTMTLQFPAVDYGLIMFSHSSGWLPEGTFAQSRSVAMDNRKELELTDFAAAIPDGQFRFILFESCHMAGVEVAYELKDKTNCILASCTEMISPGFTPLYGKLLDVLYRERPRLEDFAEAYYNHYKDAAGASVSVIHTEELTPVKYLLQEMESHVEHWEHVDRSGIQHFDRREKDYLFHDLAGYVQCVGTEDENARLNELLPRIVTYQAATPSFIPDSEYGFEIKQHCGLTIYIPLAQFKFINGERKKLKLYREVI